MRLWLEKMLAPLFTQTSPFFGGGIGQKPKDSVHGRSYCKFALVSYKTADVTSSQSGER